MQTLINPNIPGRRIQDNFSQCMNWCEDITTILLLLGAQLKQTSMNTFYSSAWDFLITFLAPLGFSPMIVPKECIMAPFFLIPSTDRLQDISKGFEEFSSTRGHVVPLLICVSYGLFFQLLDFAARQDLIGFHSRCKRVTFHLPLFCG